MHNMVTESRKRANKKWNAVNIKTISCSAKIEEYEQFKQFATARGTTMSALLLAYIRQCISEYDNTNE